MYLYNRTLTARRDRQLEAVTWAAEMGARVSSITGLDVGVWSAVFGAPITTVSWSTVIEAPSVIAAAGEKLLADPSYIEAVQGAADLWDSPAQDNIAELLVTPGDGGHGGDYASMVTATCVLGRIADAMTWGIEMAEYAHSVTGRDGAFGRALYGPFGSVGWISMASSAEEIDAAQAALGADPGYIERVDKAGGLFAPDSGTTVLSRRIG